MDRNHALELVVLRAAKISPGFRGKFDISVFEQKLIGGAPRLCDSSDIVSGAVRVCVCLVLQNDIVASCNVKCDLYTVQGVSLGAVSMRLL
jgi:hypothetical protein